MKQIVLCLFNGQVIPYEIINSHGPIIHQYSNSGGSVVCLQ